MKLSGLINHIYHVDAFTSEPFKGNPAGVVVLKELTNFEYMQNMASELNLSETAFVCELNGEYHIRFFTPFSEIPLCGHATLATAHIMFENQVASAGETLVFKTPRHTLMIHGGKHGIHMQFPTYNIETIDVEKEYTDVTGLPAPTAIYKTEHGWYMAHYVDPMDVKRAHPHFQHMKHSDFGHLIITAPADKKEDCDYILRCFVPALGIDEDPVTGSAQCVLAPFWKDKLHKTELTAFQASKRTGIMKVRSIADDKIEISGPAITIFEGVLKG